MSQKAEPDMCQWAEAEEALPEGSQRMRSALGERERTENSGGSGSEIRRNI